MKRILSIILPICLLLASCTGEQSAEKRAPATAASRSATVAPTASPGIGFRSISPQAAWALIGQRSDLMLVDLRQPEELKEGYIEGSELIPMGEIARGNKTLPSDRPLLLICAVGGRSYGVGRYYASKGYPEVYNLQGGIDAWKKADLPLLY